MLQPRHLAALREVARTGSFSQAARELSYSQPAISQQIQALESVVGLPLVIRHGRTTSLTPAGEVLLRHAHGILSSMDAAELELAEIAGLAGGQVRLAAFPSASATIVPKAVASFRAAHPEVTITLLEKLPPRSIDLVRQGECDIAVVHGATPPDQAAEDDLASVPLVEDPLILALPDAHRWAAADVVPLLEMADEDWVAGCPRCRGQLVRVCRAAGFDPKVGIETDDNAAVQGLVAAGLGVSLISELVTRAVRREGVAIRPISPDHARSVYAVALPADRRPPAVDKMLDHLQATAPRQAAA